MPSVLHAHSEYSVRDSLLRVEDLPRLAKAHGWDAVSLTDHGALEGTWAFKNACRKEGIKAICGIEIYISVPEEVIGARKSKSYHLTVLAKNANGFSSICKQLSKAHRDHYLGQKKHAVWTYENIFALEDVIILSGCYSSPFWRDHPAAADDLARFVERFGDDFFFECQALWDWDGQIFLNPVIYEMSKVFNRPLVVTPDCHFGSSDESCFHEALLAVASGDPVGSPKAWKFSTKLNFIMTPDEMAEGLSRAGIPADVARQAVENTDLVSARCKDWDWNELPKPELPTVDGSMRELAFAGLAAKGLNSDEYRDRLEYELKNFSAGPGIEQYMLLVRECVRLLKDKGARIGPRGSVGGSLVAYTMGITSVDPIYHKLLSERFFVPGRTTAPDIDLDIASSFRVQVPEILRQRFGSENVAQISNYGSFGLRQAIRDAARAYGIVLKRELSEVEFRGILSAHGNLEENVQLDEVPTWIELSRVRPDAGEFAKKLRGRIRQFGAHAGGFVISTTPLTEGRSAIVSRGKDKALVWDMEAAEKLGFVKIDFLGLDALEAIGRIEESLKIDLGTIPMDDVHVYDDLASGHTAGVPQFLTSGLKNFLSHLRPTCFEDLAWATAAFRPGALGQFKPEELAYEYRTNPDNLIVYQEDIMAICVYMAGFSWMDADKVRKIVAKKEGKIEWREWAPRFSEGCVKQGSMDADAALALWGRLEEFCRYAFPRAHAVAYSANSYKVAWAKRNHPLEAFVALLNSDPDAAEALKEEAEHFGMSVMPADPNHSNIEEWVISGKSILAPLSHVSDLRVAKLIVRMREEGPFFSELNFIARLSAYKTSPDLSKRLFGRTMECYNPLAKPVKVQWKDYIEDKKNCTQCELRQYCRKVVPPEINNSNILIVGESPGWEEDKAGLAFVGRSGTEYLWPELEKHGIKREDVSITNTAACAPNYKKIDDKTKIEKLILKCPWVPEEIKKLKPPLVLAVGRKAWQMLGGEGGITKVNGTVLEKEGMRIVACIHPAFVMRDPVMRPEFDRAIAKFAKLYKEITEKSPKTRKDSTVEAKTT